MGKYKITIVGLLGTLTTVWAGIYTYHASEKDNRRLAIENANRDRQERHEREAEDYLREQLRFYSLIHALLEANSEVFFGDVIAGQAMERSNLRKDEQIVADSILIPNNDRIVGEILKNPHLIEGDTIF
jgi:cobalamin biosynthesis protein CbiD